MSPGAAPSGGNAGRDAPLRVGFYIATRRGDTERGPQVRMRADDAQARLLTDGELVYVQGPRRRELAELVVDDTVPRGDVVVRDIAGLALSEIVTVHKPDFDRRPMRGFLA